MKSTIQQIAAGKFKAQCLQLMEEVKNEHKTILITKRGVPIAQLIPVNDEKIQAGFGCMRGTAVICGDIMEPLDVEWEAAQ